RRRADHAEAAGRRQEPRRPGGAVVKRVSEDDLDFEGVGVRHDGRLFTGVAYENWPDGTVRTEQQYSVGFPDGPSREYARSGRLLEEVLYENGELHGLSRWWDEAGRLRRERLAQVGTVIWRKDYGEDGAVQSEWHLDENSDEAQRVREVLAERAGREPGKN